MNDARKNLKRSAALLLLLAAGTLHDSFSNTARAVVITISDGTTPSLFIQVGQANTITRVNFNVKAKDIARGTPVRGNKKIDFYLYLRATAANPLTGFLTVDSSIPLSNGSGGTMPASEISWTSRDGSIPSGTFADTTNQPLATFTSSVEVTDRHSFEYRNQNVFEAGTYNGQVTYTWAAP